MSLGGFWHPLQISLVECEHGTRVESKQSLKGHGRKRKAQKLDRQEQAIIIPILMNYALRGFGCFDPYTLMVAQIDVNLRQLGPSDELGRRTIHCLLSQAERHFQLSFSSQKVCLHMEQSVALRELLKCPIQDIDGFELLI